MGQANEPVTPGGLSYGLSAVELNRLQIEAMRGDGKAAFRIAKYYLLATHEPKKIGYYWELIAAENSHLVAQYNIAFALIYHGNQMIDTIERASYWLYPLVAIGDDDAKDILSELRKLKIDISIPGDALFAIDIELIESDIQLYESGANRGSKTAARALAEYYYQIILDNEKAAYWYRIGAQNGDDECQYQYGLILYSGADKLQKERGIFWIKKAAGNGFLPAQEKLKEL